MAYNISESTRYIIVVHGMGESKPNSTVISLINRFAEARRGEQLPAPEVVTLGMVSGQASSHKGPWIEFAGIPQDPNQPVTEPFVGAPGAGGDNLRFAEIWWSDLLDKHVKETVQTPESWGQALLSRLQLKAGVPAWILDALRALVETVRVARLIMSFRFRQLEETIFYAYLGDVQAYGEYSRCRGEAVSRFHQRMEALDQSAKNARYTILAHSLGSIMSLDALLLAHADKNIQNGSYPMTNLPFDGYNGGISTAWVERVDSFVTLGSPIDKFLVLWWMNYKYLAQPPEPWMDRELAKYRKVNKIQHFNYCDEQDPVGHNLDLLEQTQAYEGIFERKEDRVYNRSVVPGLAHTEYWKDRGLLRWILYKAVDLFHSNKPKDPPKEPMWFNLGTFLEVLLISYFLVPLAAIGIDYYTFTLAWKAEGWHAAVLATVGFVVASWVGSKVLDLMVIWRRVLQVKNIRPQAQSEWGEKSASKTVLEGVFWIFTALSPFLFMKWTVEYLSKHLGEVGDLFTGHLAVWITAALTVVILWISQLRQDTQMGRFYWWGYAVYALTAFMGVVVFYLGCKGSSLECFPNWLIDALALPASLLEQLLNGPIAWLLAPFPEWLVKFPEHVANGLCDPKTDCYFNLGAFLFITTIVSIYVALRFYLAKLQISGGPGDQLKINDYLSS